MDINELKAKVYDLFVARGQLHQQLQSLDAQVLELEKQINALAEKEIPE